MLDRQNWLSIVFDRQLWSSIVFDRQLHSSHFVIRHFIHSLMSRSEMVSYHDKLETAQQDLNEILLNLLINGSNVVPQDLN